MRTLLETHDLTMRFGGLVAVDKVSLILLPGDLTGLIGPNGAGKTTFFNMITGNYAPSSGKIFFDGKRIEGKTPSTASHRGIARTYQNIRLFKDLTVLENMLVALNQSVGYSLITGLVRLPKFTREEKRLKDEAMALLKLFKLDHKAQEISKALPYGDQRRLEMARALATHPKLLLLDEPAAGMHPGETEELTELIRLLRKKFNLTILLIEHDMKLVMGLCERIYVLDHGVKIAQGTSQEIQNNPLVVEAYLGSAEGAL